MNIVEKLRLVDCTFWYKPLGHGIDTDLDVPAYELGALSHEAANEIERLREALQNIADGDVNRESVEKWREDGEYSKHDKCKHGSYMYEDCGDCIAEFARAALKEGE